MRYGRYINNPMSTIQITGLMSFSLNKYVLIKNPIPAVTHSVKDR
jgi:hypothetical protein